MPKAVRIGQPIRAELRARYATTWGHPWPHDDTDLQWCWDQARESCRVEWRFGFANYKADCLERMRECDDTGGNAPHEQT
jgi:hypothetical protein